MSRGSFPSTTSGGPPPKEEDPLLRGGKRRNDDDNDYSRGGNCIHHQQQQHHHNRRFLLTTTTTEAKKILILLVLIAIVIIVENNLFHHHQTTATTTSRSSSSGSTAPSSSSSSSSNSSCPDDNQQQWWMENSEVKRTQIYLPGQPPNSSPTSADRESKTKYSFLRHSGGEGTTTTTSRHEQELHWGVLGLGRIAHDFTTTLIRMGANVAAVAAGSLPNATYRAKVFADLYGVPNWYGTYEEMAMDPTVDIVYIATINTLHYEPAMMMLQLGKKNVLIEKPMTIHLHQASNLVQAAQENQRFLMTNYWTRWFPVMKYIRSSLLLPATAGSDDDGDERRVLGPISAMRGDFGFTTPPTTNDRYLNRSSGGGSMLDVGCYLVNLAVMVAVAAQQQQSNDTRRRVTTSFPTQIHAMAERTYLGNRYDVDTDIAFQLEWGTDDAMPLSKNNSSSNSNSNMTTRAAGTSSPTGMIMSGQASFRRPSSFEVEIDGLHGRIVIHNPANAATAATIYEYERPFGPLRKIEEVQSELPIFNDANDAFANNNFGPGNYPRGEGFAYIIHEIDQCMLEKGIPGNDDDDEDAPSGFGCLGLDDLTVEEQLLTVHITETVMEKAGYWFWN